jgi:molybdopterin-guanine dinucleotide biosynthesis protein A
MGVDKFSMTFRGKQMLEHALKCCHDVNVSEVIVVGNKDQNTKGDFKYVQDEFDDVGPLGGILSGLKMASNEINIVLPCDTPFISADVVRSLVQKAVHHEVVIACVDGKMHPTVGAYKKTLINDLSNYLNAGNRKMIDFITSVKHKILDERELKGVESNTFANLNTQKELRRYEH